MRTFEIMLLLVVTILPFVKRRLLCHIRSTYLLLLLGVLMGLHLLIEGGRWQMIPVYLLTFVLAWRIKVVDTSGFKKLSPTRVIGFLGVVLLAVLGGFLSSVLPVFTLPEPTGEYTVGTEMIYIQTDKEETITKDTDDKRELLCKVWYPSTADVSSLKGEKYVDKGSRSGFATKYGLPSNALNYLDQVETYAYKDIPVAEGTYPVLIFSHGYGSKATGYYALLSEIASHGYVIINMNHTYESLGTTFPDGRIKYFDYNFQGEISSGSMEMVQPLIDAFRNGLSYEERHPIVRKSVINYFEADIQDRWSDDMVIIVDLLEKWNTKGLLKDKLDLDKIGVFGHSVGGGSAGRLATKDSRIKAAVNLDGIQWGNMIDSTYHVPYLYVSADWPAEHEDINSHVYVNKDKGTDSFYETKLLNSGHPNFMDIPFMIPVNSLAGTGEIDPYLGNEIVTQLVTAFFDKHLKKLPNADPKNIGEKYKELEMKVYEGRTVN